MRYEYETFATMVALAMTLFALGCSHPMEPQSSEGNGAEAENKAASRGDRRADARGATSGPDAGSFSDANFEATSCQPSSPVLDLYEGTKSSVHELVTCGRLQVQTASQLIIRLVLENRDIYDETTREQLDALLEKAAELDVYEPNNPLNRQSDGSWNVMMGPESSFNVRFYEPNGQKITESPFDMDNYLEGVHFSYDMTFEEMMENIDKKNTWTVTWDEPGPLYHLLNDGKDVPNPFVIHASLIDLASVALGMPEFDGEDGPDFGPFESLFRMRIDSTVDFVHRQSDGTEVHYLAESRRKTVGKTAASSSVGFDISELRSTDGEYTLEGDATSITYEDRGLAGEIVYEISGPSTEAESVTSDFGDGRSYPKPRWQCR